MEPGAKVKDLDRSCVAAGQMQAQRLEELHEQAERTGAEVVLVQGNAFLESVGGQGAILRY